MKKQLLALLLAGLTAFSFAAFTGCTDDNTPPADNGNNEQEGEGTQKPETPGGDETQKPENPDGDGTQTPEEPELTTTPLTGKVYLVGDSTMCSFEDLYYLPRYGYGTQINKYLNCEESQIVNLALSGRSSLSFIGESNYGTLVNGVSAGDYLVIGFGHNDEKSDDPARFTNPIKSYTDNPTDGGLSFQYNLYEKYIKVAEDAGATPILCTPIVRYKDTGVYSGSVVHNTSDGDYAQAIRTLGEATGTTVIDLTAITKSIYEADNAAAAYFHAHTTYTGEKPDEVPAGRDDTHINEYGAMRIAYEFANAFKQTDCELKYHLNLDAQMPTFEVDYKNAIEHANYTKPDYSPFNPNNTTATKLGTLTTGETTVDWYKTIMGELGGNSLTPFSVSYSSGVFSAGTTQQKGKVDSKVDGFAAAFIQIGKNDNFTASATVTVKECDEENAGSMSAFGMMLRDDIIIDKRDTTLNTNYVAAGIVDNRNAIFSRESTKLTKEGNVVSVAVDSTYEVSIVRLGQAVTVTVGSFTKTYPETDFWAVDNDYMYLCLFATRGVVAEFSNVMFEITGTSQGA